MVKIHITGNSGSGKTTLAAQLAQVMGLPVFGLDKIVWQPGWKLTEKSVRETMEIELAARPSWIIEGVSRHIRQQADIIIFLDAARSVCLTRSMKRNVRYLFSGRPELPERCPEISAIWQQIEIIWKFKARTRPGIMRDMAQHCGQSHIVRSTSKNARLIQKVVAEAKNYRA